MQANYLRHLCGGDKGYTQKDSDQTKPLMAFTML